MHSVLLFVNTVRWWRLVRVLLSERGPTHTQYRAFNRLLSALVTRSNWNLQIMPLWGSRSEEGLLCIYFHSFSCIFYIQLKTQISASDEIQTNTVILKQTSKQSRKKHDHVLFVLTPAAGTSRCSPKHKCRLSVTVKQVLSQVIGSQP